MKAVQDPSVCWLAMVPDAIRTKHVLACCGPLPLFQCSRTGHLLCGTSKAADPSDAEETWSRPIPSRRMPAFIALTGIFRNSQKSQLKFRIFGFSQKSHFKFQHFGFPQKSHFKFWCFDFSQKSQLNFEHSNVPQKTQIKICWFQKPQKTQLESGLFQVLKKISNLFQKPLDKYMRT